MIPSGLIVDKLGEHGVTHVVGLPDNGSRALFEALGAAAGLAVVPVSREGEAFALASGLYLGGGKPVVLIQNTGFLETGDAFRGTAYNMGIPLVSFIGYRGYDTMAPGAPRLDTAAAFFEPTLKAWKMPYSLLRGEGDLGRIDEAFARTSSTSLPAAVLLVGETV